MTFQNNLTQCSVHLKNLPVTAVHSSCITTCTRLARIVLERHAYSVGYLCNAMAPMILRPLQGSHKQKHQGNSRKQNDGNSLGKCWAPRVVWVPAVAFYSFEITNVDKKHVNEALRGLPKPVPNLGFSFDCLFQSLLPANVCQIS
eukprot:s106_g32.t1